jgi:hypothetical protein
MKYLVFVETGGAMEDRGRCSYMYYTICEGETELEILHDWAKKNNFDKYNFYQIPNGIWVDKGYIIQIVPLYDYVPNYKLWEKLNWVSE